MKILIAAIACIFFPSLAFAASFTQTSYGSVYVSNGSWSTAWSASAGTERSAPAYVQAVTGYFLERGFIVFNTSSLGAGCTVGSASLVLAAAAIYNNGSQLETYNVYSSTGGSTVSGSDFNKGGSTPFSTAKAQTALSSSGNYTWTFNSTGLAGINTTGNTLLSVRESTYDVPDVTPVDSSYWGFNGATLNVTCVTPTSPVMSWNWIF